MQVKASKPKSKGKKCFNCQKVDHLAKDCWSKPKHQKGYAKGKGHDSRNVPHNQQTLSSSTMVPKLLPLVNPPLKTVITKTFGCHF